MKILSILLLVIAISSIVHAEDKYLPPFYSTQGKYNCEITNNYLPIAHPLNNYEWRHEKSLPYLINEEVSSYIYSSNDPDVKSKAIIHLCSRFFHHLIMHERKSEILGKSEDWFNPDCEFEGAECLYYTVVFLNDENTNYDIPVQIELFYDSKEDLDRMLNWVKTLEFKYQPNQSLKKGTAKSAAP